MAPPPPPPLPPHQEPISDHHQRSAWMDTQSSPTPRSRRKVAYSRPSTARTKFSGKNYAVSCGLLRATERHFRALRRSAAPRPMLPRPTRAHYLGYIMRVVGVWSRLCWGHVWGDTTARILPLSPFAEKATSGHSNTAAGPIAWRHQPLRCSARLPRAVSSRLGFLFHTRRAAGPLPNLQLPLRMPCLGPIAGHPCFN